jgi:arylformamidase
MSDWIDATRMLDEATIGWPNDLKFVRRQVESIDRGDGCNLSEIRTSVHIGTHIDAPAHFVPGGGTIDRIPLEVLCGRAIVAELTCDHHFTAEDLAAAGIAAHERVLLKTRNEPLWDKTAFDPTFYAFEKEAAEWLIERGVRLIGVDYLSVDPYDAPVYAAHQVLLGAGAVIIEGVALRDVPVGEYEMIALPLKLAGSDGSPARVILRPV